MYLYIYIYVYIPLYIYICIHICMHIRFVRVCQRSRFKLGWTSGEQEPLVGTSQGMRKRLRERFKGCSGGCWRVPLPFSGVVNFGRVWAV